METTNVNSKYTKILKDVFQPLNNKSYIVLGSAATFSYTSKNGYSRKINDLDVIADELVVGKIKKALLKDGFKQSTFINKRMPFFRKLNRHGDSIYLRFSKRNVYVEVLSTNFIRSDGFVKFDLYPGLWVKVPENCLTISKFENSRFSVLGINLHWAIMQFLNNTLSKVMCYKCEQRKTDLIELKKLVDVDRAKNLFSKCLFGYKFLRLKVPLFLLN